MPDRNLGDLVEILALIRKRAQYGLNSDEQGARNALKRIMKLCNEALSTSTEDTAS
jgi:hypothetical protein